MVDCLDQVGYSYLNTVPSGVAIMFTGSLYPTFFYLYLLYCIKTVQEIEITVWYLEKKYTVSECALYTE